MPRTLKQGKTMYVPNDTFTAKGPDGVDQNFYFDRTRVDEDHWAVRKYPHLFDEIRLDYSVEAATAAPGEKR